MGKIIAILNEKGGVAKTTTTKNLAVALAMYGKNVLAVDLDSSASLTTSLGVDDSMYEHTICDVFNKLIAYEDIPEKFAIIHQNEKIDLIPSEYNLREYDVKINAATDREYLLHAFIEEIKDDYDYILLDCPGGTGVLTTNALLAADELIIPTSANFLAIDAMQGMFRRISQIRKMNVRRYGKEYATKPELIGILFSMIRLNTNQDKENMAILRETYAQNNVPIFETFIPLSVNFSYSDEAGESIFKYAENTASSSVFMDFVNEFLYREGLSENK